MYGMVHTMVSILYVLNVLSRYGNNPGERHIAFLKHLLRYVKQQEGQTKVQKPPRTVEHRDDNTPHAVYTSNATLNSVATETTTTARPAI